MIDYEIPLAEYHADQAFPGNPLIEALPPMLSPVELWQQFYHYETGLPAAPMTAMERIALSYRRLREMYVPMDFVRDMYEYIYRGLWSAYSDWNPTEDVMRMNRIGKAMEEKKLKYMPCARTQAESMALLGVSGQGKTRCLEKICSLFPPVIRHGEGCCDIRLQNALQIPFVRVQCPQQDTVKGLAVQILQEIDRIAMEDAFDPMSRSSNTEMLMAQISLLCIRHHVGVIIIDEIQNVCHFSSRLKETSPRIIQFLVALANGTGVSICCVGTPDVFQLFKQQPHLMRRTRGPYIRNFGNDATFRKLCTMMIESVPLKGKNEVSRDVLDMVYKYSNGIIGVMQVLISNAASVVIGKEKEEFTPEIIRMTAYKIGLVGIRNTPVPDASDIHFLLDVDSASQPKDSSRGVPRKRGRPQVQRDEDDLLVLYKRCRERGASVTAELLQQDWVEEVQM